MEQFWQDWGFLVLVVGLGLYLSGSEITRRRGVVGLIVVAVALAVTFVLRMAERLA